MWTIFGERRIPPSLEQRTEERKLAIDASWRYRQEEVKATKQRVKEGDAVAADESTVRLGSSYWRRKKGPKFILLQESTNIRGIN